MLDSDDNDFYIGEQQIIDQEEQSTEIIKIENLQNCDLAQSKFNCKLVKIENRRGYPKFHFEIDEKRYFHRIYGIRANYEIVLRCTKSVSGSACNNRSTLLPSDFLKQIIKNSPKLSKYSKILDKSDPWVYDLKNYNLNSFDIGEGHICSGTQMKKSNNKPEICKIVEIVNSRGFPSIVVYSQSKRPQTFYLR
jgi:hypothetical protein